MGWMMDGGWGMGWGLHGVWGLLIWGGLIWAVIALVRSFQNRESVTTNQTKDDPLTILKTRYAKGELTKEEYANLREDLQA